MRHLQKYVIATGLLAAVCLFVAFIAVTRPVGAASNSAPAIQVDVPVNCGPGWAEIPSPSVASANNFLAGVSIVSPSEVWAVGAYTPTTGITQTLTERWDGAQWNIVPSPNVGTGDNQLEAVSARASNDVWAVGFYRSTLATPYQTLIIHWDGTQWTQTASPSPGSAENYLYGVTTISATDAWAVGYYSNTTNIYQTLTEHWNGTQWTYVQSPTPFLNIAGLRGVSAVSSNDVWAVGVVADITLVYKTYTIHWNGSTWSAVTSLSNSNCIFTAVATVATDNVWAVGACSDGTHYQTLAAHWNGSSWSMVPTPSPGTGDNALGGIAVVSANDIWAVGGYGTGAAVLTLALHWDGTAWTQGKSASPGVTASSLLAVSANGGSLWATGSYDSDTGGRTLTEQYGNVPCVTATATASTVATETATGLPTLTATIPVLPSSTSTSLATATSITTGTTVPSATVTQVAGTATATVTFVLPTGTSVAGTATATTATTATASPIAPTMTPTVGGGTVTVTPTACLISFSDVSADSTFYPFIRCLACRGIISGYADGTFRPGNEITRGQIAKMVSNAAGFSEDPGSQIYRDVDTSSTFYTWINRLSNRGFMGGYPCGSVPQEPCVSPDNLPYFRPFANATRGQLAKIVANAAEVGGSPTDLFYTDVPEDNPFYLWIMRLTDLGVMSGYSCGGPSEPCDDQQRPYFRPFANVTRGQASKIVANTFLPGCQTPERR